MPLYEYYCPKCASTYELLRPMARSDEPGTCPKGHRAGARTITAFAPMAKSPSGESMPMPMGGGCGCGGGACACGH
jgi:putative FmdB family regulatory protein